MPASRVHFTGPVVCRSPGLPFATVERFSNVPDAPDALAARLDADRRRLWSTLDDPHVLDAFATMNPQTLTTLLATKDAGRHLGKRTSDVRRDERTLFKFLTRFSSRNDTTGAAGSTCWGSWTGGAFAAKVTPGSGRHARRVVLASPRRLSWLWRRVVEKTHRLHGRVELAGRLLLTDQGVLNTESGVLWALDGEERDALAHLPTTTWSPVVGRLLDRGVLTLTATGPGDPLEALAVQSGDEVVRALLALQHQLVSARGLEGARVMGDAERLVGSAAPLASLDLGAALDVVLNDLIREAPTALRVLRSRRFRPMEGVFHDTLGAGDLTAPAPIIDALAHLDTPVPLSALTHVLSAEHALKLLRAGVLLLEGEALDGPIAGLEARFASQVGALCSQPLPPPHARRVELLRDAWPLEGFHQPTSVATGLLTEALRGQEPPVRTLKTDRTFFIEDTSRDVAFELGEAFARRLRSSLHPWFQLAGYISWLDERRDETLQRGLLRLGDALPLPTFLSRLRAAKRARRRQWLIERRLGVAAPVEDFSCFSFAPREDGRVELSLEHLPQAYLEWERSKRLITELDLMVSGRDGMGRWVVNEAHAISAEGLPLVTMFPHAQPPEQVDALVGRGIAQRLFGEGVLVPDASAHSKQSEAILRVLGDATIAVTGQRGPWIPPWMTTVRAADVLVRRTGRGLEVFCDGAPRPFASADFCSGDFRLVGYLPEDIADLAAHAMGETQGPLGSRYSPDVCMGELTLARGSLSFDVKLLEPLVRAKGEAALVSTAKALAAELGLPRQVYVKLGGKPFLVDWASLFSLEVFVSELRGATGTLHVSKMDPAPDELWLELPEGVFTSELRFVACLDGPDCPLKDAR
ncbi:MAG: hypothetical protein JNJ54_13175 [Myxococcaceae bacterium]|nr:hypothetical protein [Myxococcaceae bacterium]